MIRVVVASHLFESLPRSIMTKLTFLPQDDYYNCWEDNVASSRAFRLINLLFAGAVKVSLCLSSVASQSTRNLIKIAKSVYKSEEIICPIISDETWRVGRLFDISLRFTEHIQSSCDKISGCTYAEFTIPSISYRLSSFGDLAVYFSPFRKNPRVHRDVPSTPSFDSHTFRNLCPERSSVFCVYLPSFLRVSHSRPSFAGLIETLMTISRVIIRDEVISRMFAKYFYVIYPEGVTKNY